MKEVSGFGALGAGDGGFQGQGSGFTLGGSLCFFQQPGLKWLK